MPDLSRLTAAHHGINAKAGTAFSLSVLPVPPNQPFFAVQFDGYLYAPADDVYTFGLPPEERGRLTIGDRIVVGPDLANIGRVALKKGLHSINVQYFHEGRPSEIKLEWSRTGNSGMQEVPSTAVSTLLPQPTRGRSTNQEGAQQGTPKTQTTVRAKGFGCQSDR